MICVSCRAAGTANGAGDYAIAVVLHQGCTKCECQHKTGAGWYKTGKEKPPTREA
jgi:hypothetical protein